MAFSSGSNSGSMGMRRAVSDFVVVVRPRLWSVRAVNVERPVGEIHVRPFERRQLARARARALG
jgi:hypothetical protein